MLPTTTRLSARFARPSSPVGNPQNRLETRPDLEVALPRLEYHECDPARLKHAREVKALLCSAVGLGGGKIVKAVFHNFSPHGVSGGVVNIESHVTIHTWPSHAHAAVDIFSCRPRLDHAEIQAQLKKALSAKRVARRSFRRGLARGRLGADGWSSLQVAPLG